MIELRALISTCKAVFHLLTTVQFPRYNVPIPFSSLEAEAAPITSSTFVTSTNVAADADTARPNLHPCSLRLQPANFLVLLPSERWKIGFCDGAWSNAFVREKELFFTIGSCWSSLASPLLADDDAWLVALSRQSQVGLHQSRHADTP